MSRDAGASAACRCLEIWRVLRHGPQRWFFVLPLLLALASGCSKSPIDRAQAFLDADMASQAIPLLQIEIQANPKNARAHLMLGQASLMLNDQAAAKESFDRAVLLNPGWADKVGRAYLDAANKLISGAPSETRLAVSYLETARAKTRSLDKDIARSLRRAGLGVGSAELLHSAVQADAALAQDDSVAAYLAITGAEQPSLRISAMEQFLVQFPKSPLRPVVLVQIAQAEMGVGNRPKAKAYAQEAVTLPGDPAAAIEAKSLLEQIAGVDRAEVEAGVATQQAQAQTQQALARRKLIEQEAQARAVQARAEAEAANAKAATERQQQLARQQQQRQEELARLQSELPIGYALLGRWYFDRSPGNNPRACAGGYIEFEAVSISGSLAGAFVCPEGPRRFEGTLNGTRVDLIIRVPVEDSSPDGEQKRRMYSGTVDVRAGTILGDARDIERGSWVLRAGWAATKR